jgi:protein CpxP
MTYLSSPIKFYAASVAIALAGAFAVSASAAPGGPGMMDHGPMMGQGAWGGPMMGGMLPRLLDRVNATPEQRAQIKQILDKNAGEMRAQHEAGRALRDQAMALFAQPTVDANAVEALRQKQLAAHDAASRRVMTAMLEVSAVLTPEQRKQMAEQMTQRREMMQRHYRERQAIDAPKS